MDCQCRPILRGRIEPLYNAYFPTDGRRALYCFDLHKGYCAISSAAQVRHKPQAMPKAAPLGASVPSKTTMES